MISNIPQFITIAGPNGAGKSTVSHNLLKHFSVSAFDWDKEFYLQWSQFSYDPAVMEGVQEATNRKFKESYQNAKNHQLHFAYETNFHSNFSLELANQFKSTGYGTSLYFLFVSSVNICKERVRYRFEIEAGHHVSEKTIESRFKDGLRNLDTAISVFDRVFVYDTGIFKNMEPMMAFEQGKVISLDKKFPTQFSETLPSIAKAQEDYFI